ncbi:MAG TPA: hypothetical protein VFA81_06460 [Burkholderiales bacterium]|nr:hypothetical protein [Burkholderiales bacterium]
MSRRLMMVWGILLLLVAGIGVLEWKDRGPSSEATHSGARDPRMLLPVSLDELGAIEIAQGGSIHRFERDAAGLWFYHGAHAGAPAAHAHQTDPALAERIAYALAGFDRARRERHFPLRDGGKDFGVATPQMVILVYRPKSIQPLAQYAVGDLAPDNLSRYVLQVGESQVQTIANYQIDNLLKLIKTAAEATQSTQNAAVAR